MASTSTPQTSASDGPGDQLPSVVVITCNFDGSQDICRVCLEPVAASGRRYALFERCDHRYCEPCGRTLMAHRSLDDQESAIIKCPTCRTPSYRIAISMQFLMMEDPLRTDLFDSVICCANDHRHQEGLRHDLARIEYLRAIDARDRYRISLTLADLSRLFNDNP